MRNPRRVPESNPPLFLRKLKAFVERGGLVHRSIRIIQLRPKIILRIPTDSKLVHPIQPVVRHRFPQHGRQTLIPTTIHQKQGIRTSAEQVQIFPIITPLQWLQKLESELVRKVIPRVLRFHSQRMKHPDPVSLIEAIVVIFLSYLRGQIPDRRIFRVHEDEIGFVGLDG